MRAFAKHLEIHPSALSRILAGKQKMSSGAAVTVAQKIGLNGDASRLFFQSIADEQFNEAKTELGKAINLPELKLSPQKINESDFSIISRVSCLAIRELMLTENFVSDIGWISERLNEPCEKVKECLQALIRVGLVEEENGQLRPVNRHLTTVNTERSTAIRMTLQKEILEKSMKSLDKDSFEKRAHYGMTMAINPDRIELANKMILEFMEKLCDFLETNPREEVYQLAVQLFPLTEINSKKENLQ